MLSFLGLVIVLVERAFWLRGQAVFLTSSDGAGVRFLEIKRMACPCGATPTTARVMWPAYWASAWLAHTAMS